MAYSALLFTCGYHDALLSFARRDSSRKAAIRITSRRHYLSERDIHHSLRLLIQLMMNDINVLFSLVNVSRLLIGCSSRQIFRFTYLSKIEIEAITIVNYCLLLIFGVIIISLMFDIEHISHRVLNSFFRSKS